MPAASTQYVTEANLRARQRLWEISPRQPAFSLYPWVLGLARLAGGEAVLDVGCGNGAYLELVDAVGLDASLGMLTAARRRALGPLVAGDAACLPFADSSFDVVLAPHMLYHVEDRRTAATELRRVLRSSGTCVVVTNGESNQREVMALVEDVVGNGWRWERPAHVAFSLENGGEQLATAFERVQRLDCPPTVVSVTDPDALADYLRSVGEHYEAQIAAWTTWEEVVVECHRRVAATVEADGAFRISMSVGAFVCS